MFSLLRLLCRVIDIPGLPLQSGVSVGTTAPSDRLAIGHHSCIHSADQPSCIYQFSDVLLELVSEPLGSHGVLLGWRIWRAWLAPGLPCHWMVVSFLGVYLRLVACRILRRVKHGADAERLLQEPTDDMTTHIGQRPLHREPHIFGNNHGLVFFFVVIKLLLQSCQNFHVCISPRAVHSGKEQDADEVRCVCFPSSMHDIMRPTMSACLSTASSHRERDSRNAMQVFYLLFYLIPIQSPYVDRLGQGQ
jgi:hypothetical protein